MVDLKLNTFKIFIQMKLWVATHNFKSVKI